MTEVQQLEQLMNEMLPGLQLFARDINLTPEKFQVADQARSLYRRRAGWAGMVTTQPGVLYLSNHSLTPRALTGATRGQPRQPLQGAVVTYEHEVGRRRFSSCICRTTCWKWMSMNLIRAGGHDSRE